MRFFRLICSLFFLSLNTIGFAQCINEDTENDKKKRDCYDAISVNINSGYFRKSLPYDEPFFIKIIDSNKKAKEVKIKITPLREYKCDNRKNNSIVIRKKTEFNAKRIANSDTFYVLINKFLEPGKSYRFCFGNDYQTNDEITEMNIKIKNFVKNYLENNKFDFDDAKPEKLMDTLSEYFQKENICLEFDFRKKLIEVEIDKYLLSTKEYFTNTNLFLDNNPQIINNENRDYLTKESLDVRNTQFVYNDLKQVSTQLPNNPANFSDIKIDEILNNIITNGINNSFIPVSTISGYESRAKSYISGDVGVLIMPNLVIDKKIKNYTASPYIGMNFYFSPVNKYTPLGAYRNSGGYGFRKKISLTIGTTFSLTQSDDFKIGYLIGFGYRITSAIRLSTGYVMYNSKEGSMLDTTYKFKGMPYVSLSLDWDLRDLIPRRKDL